MGFEFRTWKEESGVLGFREWEKGRAVSKKVEKDLPKIAELDRKDLIELVLHANKKKMLKTRLYKELFLLSERTGISKIMPFEWYPANYGPFSEKMAQDLEQLKKDGRIREKIIKNRNNMFEYELIDAERTEKIWEKLPGSFKHALVEIAEEFKDKKVDEISHYIHVAYPKYATAVKC
jgi:uncharacterized protein YwgA